ncbi:c-type cytochrome [Variovorax sp. UC122_21]|uniref:c-type cytochrome n=1 Tax=Variovorax sp. UC122_21 TaxID=3374554 RepID=UPI00375683C2
MNALPDAAWLNVLIEGLQTLQLQLLRLLDALGLVAHAHGQPAWPWDQRLSGENLLIDLGQARRLGISVVLLGLSLLVLIAALLWRRRRIWLLGAAALPVVLAPWPDAHVVLVPAHPTSFQQHAAGFSAESIARGRSLYAQNCVACHGSDGRGQGPLAAAQPVWPPNLTGPLLWRRADGDLLWRVLHGTRDRHGALTMPGFQGRLSESDAWALIDYMKAQAAGESLRVAGVWAQPVSPPDMAVRCDGKPVRMLSSWRGQRLRIVAGGDNASALLEDPRLVTVLLEREPAAASKQDDRSIACVADSPEAWEAFSLIAATEKLEGTQLLVDRAGWLRARGEPGKSAWSDDDLLCRAETASATATVVAGAADGLGALITRMDAQPVRFVKGGFVH